MPSYAHTKLIEEIRRIDALPGNDVDLATWVKGGKHLAFLSRNAKSDEIVVYANGPYSFITSILVPDEILFPEDWDDLLKWSGNPFSGIASYTYGGGRKDVWIEPTTSIDSSKVLAKGKDLIYGRTFEGWTGDGRNYFEVHPEYTHLAGIHWRPEHGSYCHFDQNGDLEHIVSITSGNDLMTLVSFAWPKFEEYLTISKSSLVRMFDFTLLRREKFNGWGNGEEDVVVADPNMQYRQRLIGLAGYTRGVQIIRPRLPAEEVYNNFTGGWFTPKDRQYAEFIAQDWLNKRVTKISTDPKATTNYFEAKDNDLPFELSPAFFRAEVLSKYKADREKYRIEDRSIHCRSAWYLKSYDVNEAGQVHAYICDLRLLPYAEQLHWQSYNEAPKTGISERAYTTDFLGQFVTVRHPREQVLSILRRWYDKNVSWWTLRDDDLLHRANTPLTNSREEWANAYMDLSQLIVEGFEMKPIRKMLEVAGVTSAPDDKSIVLLEKLITNATGAEEPVSLTGLRQVQQIRSKVKGHAGSTEGKKLADEAIAKDGSFTKHFERVCELVAAELETIERICGRHQS